MTEQLSYVVRRDRWCFCTSSATSF